MTKIAAGLGAPLAEMLGAPEMSAETLEGARHLSALSFEVRRPIVGSLRALATWAVGSLMSPAVSGSPPATGSH